MNIFFLSENPYEAARFMVDKHAKGGKMACEAGSMLANCFSKDRLKNAPLTQSGRVRGWSWYNHPCSIWVRESKANYNWLLNHAFGILKERYYRTGKGHFISNFIVWCADNEPDNISNTDIFTTPALAMPESCILDNAIASYRNYYNLEKRHLFKWTKRDIPFFITQKDNIQ